MTKLKAYIKERNIKQKSIVEKTGLTPAIVCNIVNGVAKDFKMSTANKICEAIGASFDEVFDMNFIPAIE